MAGWSIEATVAVSAAALFTSVVPDSLVRYCSVRSSLNNNSVSDAMQSYSIYALLKAHGASMNMSYMITNSLTNEVKPHPITYLKLCFTENPRC